MPPGKDRPTRGRETQRMAIMSAAELPTASMIGLLTGSAPLASRPPAPPGRPCGPALTPAQRSPSTRPRHELEIEDIIKQQRPCQLDWEQGLHPGP
jgi:hypothetical protein